jgi:nifR3 family TIM-barrel protein
MYKGFWQTLQRPIIGLSPMDGVTDFPYRQIQKQYGHPDVVFTEFVAAEGLSRNAIKIMKELKFSEAQRPIVAQIFGKEPASFRTTALILGYLGFDGIDINMGCPAKSVRQHGAGAALIRTPALAAEIIKATQAGVQDWTDGKTLDDCPSLKTAMKKAILELHDQLPEEYQQRHLLPVSVKTRVGFDQPVVKEWISHLLSMDLAAITVHGRTLEQGYSGWADWNHIKTAVELAKGTDTLILGNGDITSPEICYQRLQETGVAGVLLGRATFGNPWLLADCQRYCQLPTEVERASFAPTQPTLADRIKLSLDHAHCFEQAFPDSGFFAMRKHLAWYVREFPFASDVRQKLVLANSAQEVADIFQAAGLV